MIFLTLELRVQKLDFWNTTMEIKIICASCGTKFAFDVQPVHGRMPAPVACPGCGVDATAQANTEISNALASAPAAAPVPVARPVSVATPIGAPPAASAPPPGAGLRINRPHAEAAAPGGIAAPPPLPYAAPGRPSAPPPKPQSASSKKMSTILAVIVGILAVLGYGYRWARRISAFSRAARQVAAAHNNNNDESADSGGPKNLWYEKCAILIVQHTNHLEVADACKTFWNDNLHKNLVLTQSKGDEMSPGEYELISAHNGYVRILGAHEWPIPQHEALAQFLSQKFGGLVFEWRSESFADTYHFGVFDQGVKKFHAQMDIKGADADEVVTTSGNDYALAHGFKPGPEGFKEFSVIEADAITRNLGLNLGDESEGLQTNTVMLLKDIGALPRAK
jgi:hypothetical protein